MLRKVCLLKRQQVIENYTKLHNEKTKVCYASTNIIWFIKLSSLWLARHVTRDREGSKAYRILVKNLKEENNLEKLGLDGKIKLKYILRK
jgi:hypothetical protein